MDKTYNLPELLQQLEQGLRSYLEEKSIKKPLLVGIHTSGVWLANELHQRLGLEASDLGELDISFYRDDFDRVGLSSQKQPSRLPLSVTDRDVVLVDDVLHTGRTVRAAMNELFDYGRPNSISLITLVSRGGRQLPIESQVCALVEEPGEEWLYHFEGPNPMKMSLVPKAA